MVKRFHTTLQEQMQYRYYRPVWGQFVRALCENQKKNRKSIYSKDLRFFLVIGATGFEPATSWSQTKRSTELSYAPLICKT